MRIPTRSAPPPPPPLPASSSSLSSTSSSSSGAAAAATTALLPPPLPVALGLHQEGTEIWNTSNGILRTSVATARAIEKRKPPPRPPPPKFYHARSHDTEGDKQRKPARPTELLTNLFGRRKQEQNTVNVRLRRHAPTATRTETSCTNESVCLIDLSPPGSPTPTTRSSSDRVSVDSFGSDGNSTPSTFTSSGNTSQTESGFEDDFDFFGICTRKLTQPDSWAKKAAPDPFGPFEEVSSEAFSHASSFAGMSAVLGNARSNVRSKSQASNVATSNSIRSVRSMPTIIRAKPPKPPAPKILQDTRQQGSYGNVADLVDLANFASSANCANSQSQSRITVCSSLNFPNCPRVALAKPEPLDLNEMPSATLPIATIPPPTLLPRSSTDDIGSRFQPGNKEPYGIALYDYPLTHPDDLSFKEGETVTLVRKINDDWMMGRIGNREGMFPSSFVDIRLPLSVVPDNVVMALYSFKAETPEDLSFSEGEKITVLARISEDWLYGQCGTRKGQFPINYVNRIPSDASLV